MPTCFSVFLRSDHEISITYAFPKDKMCLQLSNVREAVNVKMQIEEMKTYREYVAYKNTNVQAEASS